MKLRYKILLILSIIVAIFLWGRSSKQGPTKTSGLLPKEDLEQIHFNPVSHTITVTTLTGTKVLTLPDRDSIIDLNKDGSLRLTSPQFGIECHPFMSGLISNKFILGAGVDLVYYKKLDLGLGFGTTLRGTSPLLFAKLTYTLYGNLQAGAVYGTNNYIGGVLSVRLF